jgi:hypothetical protein
MSKNHKKKLDWLKVFPQLTRILMEALLFVLFVIAAIEIILHALRNL